MYCVSDAESGGENFFMDPEITYIRLREMNPDYIVALSHPAVMSVPANEQDGTEIRGEIPGPVFSIHPGDGDLAMRYTARTRSIAWRDDPLTRQVVTALADILKAPGKDVLRHRLSPGQGVITNNVLHGRTAFRDSETGGRRRLVYRARFHDRISGTSLDDARPA
jgi:alpha-ketoglutarate-dependent taurine dioxygenase